MAVLGGKRFSPKRAQALQEYSVLVLPTQCFLITSGSALRPSFNAFNADPFNAIEDPSARPPPPTSAVGVGIR